jgi:glycerol-3-phosphate acyltransferase PlsY
MSLLDLALLIAGSYLIGSIPTGFWLVKALKGIDIRQYGSGSTGATNVWRCVGKWQGIAVFFIDTSKGIIPVRVAIALGASLGWSFPDPYHLIAVLVALAALIGHGKSIFLNFQGGKSAATGLGTLLALDLGVGVATFATWCLVLLVWRMVSLASIVGVGFCGAYMAIAKEPLSYVAYGITGFLYVTYRHKANIQRILNGTEPRLGGSGAKSCQNLAEPMAGHTNGSINEVKGNGSSSSKSAQSTENN